MRLGRMEGPKPILAHGETVVDLQQIADVSDDLVEMLADSETQRQIRLIEKGQPPQKSWVAKRNVKWLPPVDRNKWALRGGTQEDVEVQVHGHGATLPAGMWSTGVAAVVHKTKVIGYTVFHRVGDQACLGPWLVSADAVPDPHSLVFAAFVDFEPVVRPAKALLDWDSEAKLADMVCLATPPQEARGEVRCALSLEGKTLVRLEATLEEAVESTSSGDESSGHVDDASTASQEPSFGAKQAGENLNELNAGDSSHPA